MKAMVLTGIRQMELVERPEPEIRHPYEVKIRMGAVGVCGSDLHYYSWGGIGAQVVQYPFAVGHECAGTVVDVGLAVTRVKPGDRIAIEPAVVCGDCDQCRAGRENTCRKNRFLGCPGQLEGALAEYLVMPEENCFPIQPTTDLGVATISEPLAIGIYAVGGAKLPPDAAVGILGMGPIGTCVLLPALVEGAGRVYCTDRLDYRGELARRNGATWAGNPEQEDVVAAILDREPLGLDVVFECCGKQEAIDQAVKLLKPGAKLLIIGIPADGRISFQTELGRRKELTIINVRRQVGCVQAALDYIEQQKIDVLPMITHRFSFEQSKQAFDLVDNYSDGVLKAIIDFPSL